MPFIHDDFLLETDAARRLYHEYAAQEPILDYHTHLDAAQIASNRRFEDLTAIWLEGDHYKWRAMRAHGVDEEFITGGGSARQKFLAWAKTVPHTLRNPLYHWTHLELKRYFDIDLLLNEATAEEIWQEANRQLATDELRVHGIFKKFKVRAVCTTDDPTDDLPHHLEISNQRQATRVLPSYRPDPVFNVQRAADWNGWIDRLADRCGIKIQVFGDLLSALRQRHADFHQLGCRVSDHGLNQCFGLQCDEQTASDVFRDVRSGVPANRTQAELFGAYMMAFFGKLDVERGWAKQLHLGPIRAVNSRRLSELGPDTGFDTIGDFSQGQSMAAMFDFMERQDALPKMIIYNINPSDNYLFASMIGSFQGGIPGKMQFGSGWWFLDQKEAMEWQINALSNLGLLSHFVGMLTDSRSFMSFPRHEYFRRVLCNLLGTDMERGELPDDDSMIGELVRRICFENARRYFEFVLD